MAGKPIKADVQRYFTEHIGTRVFLKDLVEALGEGEQRIQSAINNMRRDEADSWGKELSVDIRGQAWTYRPTTRKDDGKRIFAELGVSVAGEIVIQDEAGKLYKAVEL